MEEEKIYKDIELRSEEVQEVMNHISPGWWWVWDYCLGSDSVDGTGWLLDIQVSGHLGGRGDSSTEEPPPLCCHMLLGNSDTLYVKNGEFGGADGFGCDCAACSEDVRLPKWMKAWKRRIMIGRKEWSFYRQALAVGELQSAFAVFITHHRICTFWRSWTITLETLVSSEKQLGGQRSIFGWQSGNMS